jgi:hypothetical protein
LEPQTFLEIAFASQALRRICEDDRAASRVLGEECAMQLRHRLADLRAADSCKALIVGSPEPILVEGVAAMAIALVGGSFLTVVPNHENPPVDKAGNVDWGRVGRAKVISVGDKI